MIQFQAKYLPALLRFRGLKDVRHYLRGVHITPHQDGGAVLVATNGKIMLAIRDNQAICSSDTTVSIAQGIDRFCKKPGAIVSVNEITQRLIISDHDDELYVQPGKCLIDGKFPDWRRVVPKFADLKLAVSDHMASGFIAAAIGAHPGNGKGPYLDHRAVRFWQVSKNNVVAVEYAGAPEMCGLIMPVRDDFVPKDVVGGWATQFGLPSLASVPA